MYGNGDVELAKTMGKDIDDLVKTKEVLHKINHHQLPKGLTLIQERNKNKEDKNSASDVYIQIGSDKVLENVVLLDLLVPLLKEKAFDQLRTKETLGYIVSAGGGSYGYVLYSRLVVVGPKHDSAMFLERILAFLTTFGDKFIGNMTDSAFSERKTSTIKGYTRTDLSLAQKDDLVFSQIVSANYDFEHRKKLKEIALKTTLEDLKKFYDKYFLSDERRLFAVQLFAHSRNQTLPKIPHRILASEQALKSREGGKVFEHDIHMHGLH
jgi:secreted Zn-dependent insulinase-like peptidase